MRPPIADPTELPAPADPTRRYFPFSLWRCAVATLPVAVVSDLIVAAYIPSRPDNRTLTILFIVPCAFILAAMLQLALYSMWASKSHLKAPNLWGLSREIEWSQISRARFLWFGWPYLVISTRQKRNVIWIPLFLRDMKSFARAVEEWAPDENPLRLWLKGRGF